MSIFARSARRDYSFPLLSHRSSQCAIKCEVFKIVPLETVIILKRDRASGWVNREVRRRLHRIADAQSARNRPSLVPHVPRYLANRSSARYERAFEEYTKRHAKRGGTATPWSNLEVSSVGRRSFVSRHLRESLSSLSLSPAAPPRRSPRCFTPVPVSRSLVLSRSCLGSLHPGS